jgi:hypothetical protein
MAQLIIAESEFNSEAICDLTHGEVTHNHGVAGITNMSYMPVPREEMLVISGYDYIYNYTRDDFRHVYEGDFNTLFQPLVNPFAEYNAKSILFHTPNDVEEVKKCLDNCIWTVRVIGGGTSLHPGFSPDFSEGYVITERVWIAGQPPIPFKGERHG